MLGESRLYTSKDQVDQMGEYNGQLIYEELCKGDYVRNRQFLECAENVYIPCDAMIVAIGQNIETEHFKESGVPIDRWNDIYANKAGTFHNMPDVFSAGDCVSGPASVISAIGQAKTVAANIDEYLGYHHEITVDVEIPAASIADRTPCGRVNLTEREACERVKDFEGVENGMTLKEAQQEASRCLRCDHFGYGLFRGGREKLW